MNSTLNTAKHNKQVMEQIHQAINRDGRIVLVGSSANNLALARHWP